MGPGAAGLRRGRLISKSAESLGRVSILVQLLTFNKQGDAVKTLRPETLDQLSDRWTVLINEINRTAGPYPNALSMDVLILIRQTEHMINPDPFEQDLIYTARKLAEDRNLKLALFKLHEVIHTRLEGG
jgi:hypothetical protein